VISAEFERAKDPAVRKVGGGVSLTIVVLYDLNRGNLQPDFPVLLDLEASQIPTS
jgi:hypothetical protein